MKRLFFNHPTLCHDLVKNVLHGHNSKLMDKLSTFEEKLDALTDAQERVAFIHQFSDSKVNRPVVKLLVAQWAEPEKTKMKRSRGTVSSKSSYYE